MPIAASEANATARMRARGQPPFPAKEVSCELGWSMLASFNIRKVQCCHSHMPETLERIRRTSRQRLQDFHYLDQCRSLLNAHTSSVPYSGNAPFRLQVRHLFSFPRSQCSNRADASFRAFEKSHAVSSSCLASKLLAECSFRNFPGLGTRCDQGSV